MSACLASTVFVTLRIREFQARTSLLKVLRDCGELSQAGKSRGSRAKNSCLAFSKYPLSSLFYFAEISAFATLRPTCATKSATLP